MTVLLEYFVLNILLLAINIYIYNYNWEKIFRCYFHLKNLQVNISCSYINHCINLLQSSQLTRSVVIRTYNNAYGSDGTLTFIANQSSSFYIKNLLLHMKSIVDTSDSHRQTDGRTDRQTDRQTIEHKAAVH